MLLCSPPGGLVRPMAEKEATGEGKPRKELHQKGREERRTDRQTIRRKKNNCNNKCMCKSAGSEAEMDE